MGKENNSSSQMRPSPKHRLCSTGDSKGGPQRLFSLEEPFKQILKVFLKFPPLGMFTGNQVPTKFLISQEILKNTFIL